MHNLSHGERAWCDLGRLGFNKKDQQGVKGFSSCFFRGLLSDSYPRVGAKDSKKVSFLIAGSKQLQTASGVASSTCRFMCGSLGSFTSTSPALGAEDEMQSCHIN